MGCQNRDVAAVRTPGAETGRRRARRSGKDSWPNEAPGAESRIWQPWTSAGYDPAVTRRDGGGEKAQPPGGDRQAGPGRGPGYVPRQWSPGRMRGKSAETPWLRNEAANPVPPQLRMDPNIPTACNRGREVGLGTHRPTRWQPRRPGREPT